MKIQMIVSRLFALVTVFSLVLHVSAPIAAAHPLGNFTINHYAGLYFDQNEITLDFVLDMAEIPAFQEIATFDANGNGQADASEATGYPAAKCESIRPELMLQFDGQPLSLTLNSSAVEFPPGAGGLPTLRLTCEFQTVLPDASGSHQFQLVNNVYHERLGWREIVVTGDGVVLPANLAAMSGSISQRLTAYPDNLLAEPLNQRQLSFALMPVDGPAPQSAQLGTSGQSLEQSLPEREDGFTQLISLQHLTFQTVLIALVVAFVWGAAHALTPGHGKTIVAAYLVGSRGTVQHALFLGLTTTITHTAGVFLLGFLTLFASRFILPEQLYPWLGVISGALVVGIGLSLFRGQLRGFIGHKHHHHHHHHHNSQDHVHQDDELHHNNELGHHIHHHHTAGTHSHMPPGADDDPITWRSLLALGVSGGLIPCPSALIVMLSAIALQRIGFGLVLIVAFSLGLAGVLTLIGVVWVQARRLFEVLPKQGRFRDRILGSGGWLHLLPAASALFITIVGVGITLKALAQTGYFI